MHLHRVARAVFPLLVLPLLAFGHEVAPLPNPGLTPESSFYFLDRLGEAIREFLTFSPEAKARLHVAFAAERIAEIKVVFEAKGVEARGLDVALSRLQTNIERARQAVETAEAAGRDVSDLALDISEDFAARRAALKLAFAEEEAKLETREDELKNQIRAARDAGNAAEVERLAGELGRLKAEQELLDIKAEGEEQALEAEEEKIEEKLKAKAKAEKAIREAEEEKAEVAAEAVEEGVTLPAGAFLEFDSLLAEASSTLAAENFREARQLARRAEAALKSVERTIRGLEEQNDLREDAEEAIAEARFELQVLQLRATSSDAIPADVLGRFNGLIGEATSALEARDFRRAKAAAQRAEKAVDEAEEAIEEATDKHRGRDGESERTGENRSGPNRNGDGDTDEE